MKKKVLATLLCLAMAATMVVGCGSKAADAPAADAPAADAPAADAPAADAPAASGDLEFAIIVKSFQSSYWQAAVKGVEEEAAKAGVKVTCQGPNAESDIADQVNMLNAAIDQEGIDGIGLAACDQSACLESLQKAMEKKIPVVCFDSGIPDAPAGSVCSTVATDNYGAGATAAENLYAALKDKVAAASSSAQVRIGEVNQEATSESITSRGLGFIDKFIELAKADGKKVAVIGNEKYVNDSSADKVAEGEADVVIEVAVPAQTTVELCATEAANILNKADTIGVFGSNQVAAEGILTADENIGKLGKDILAAGFDAGTVIKTAIKDGKMYGAVTQSPLAMGITTVDVLVKAAKGESVQDVPTDGYWYNADNMEDASIAPNLYD